MSQEVKEPGNIGEGVSSSISPLPIGNMKRDSTNSSDRNSQSHNHVVDLYDITQNSPVGVKMEISADEAKLTEDEMEVSADEVMLAQLLMEENIDKREIAEAWINTHESSPFEAMRSILELILNSTGILQPLTKEQALKLDKLNEATFDKWVPESEELCLISDDTYSKNLFKFFELIFVDAVLDDILIMKRIKNLLTVLLYSTWVCARYASVMIGSLIAKIYLRYLSELDAEIHNILADGNEINLKEKIAVAEDLFEHFAQIVGFASRDVNLFLRKTAFKMVSFWCFKKEKLFLADIHLRYLHWALFDENAEIRLIAIKTCRSLYDTENVMNSLEVFVKKSLPALVIRAQDISSHVSTAAVEIIADIHRRYPRLLKDADVKVDLILMLVYSAERSVAAKATEFLHKIIKEVSPTNMNFIYNSILFIEESMIELGQDTNTESVVGVLVRNLYPLSHEELSDWVAWRKLLLGNSLTRPEHLQELACLLLVKILDCASMYAEDRFFVEINYPLVPTRQGYPVTEKTSVGLVNKELKNKCLNHLVKMTLILGPELLRLLKKFKNKRICLSKLVSIPQYFNGNIESLNLKRIFCCLTTLRKYYLDSTTMYAVHRTKACLYHLMSFSQKWKRFIPQFEKVLFRGVIRKFINACIRLAERPLPKRVEVHCMKIVKQAFFLSKFFDVTKTPLLDDALYALRCGKYKSKPNVICPTAMMCLYILQWQLKNVAEKDLDKHEVVSQLHKIQSQSRTLVLQLEPLLSNKNSALRETAYSTLCRLYLMLCPRNIYVKCYPLIHLPQPSVEAKEWINYNLVRQVSCKHIPEDRNEFEMSCKALALFCTMLQAQVLSLGYLSSIFCYLKFFQHPKNYNSLLEKTFHVLAKARKSFSYEVMESLIWIKVNDYDNVEDITKGLCSVVLSTLKPVQFGQKTALEMLRFGLSLICKPEHHFVFCLLAPFVKLLGKKDAKKLYRIVTDAFHLYLEEEEVKMFLTAFRKTKGTQEGAE